MKTRRKRLVGLEEKGTGREEETGVGRQGGRKKIKGQAGKKRQGWGDKEEEAGGVGRERDRQGRRDRCGETKRKSLV